MVLCTIDILYFLMVGPNYRVLEHRCKTNVTGTGLACFIGLLPILIVLLLSRLSPGNSTYAQRSWLMTWMVFGGLFGPIIEWRRDELVSYGSSTWAAQMSTVGFGAFFAVPAIGGFVVVGQMLASYGNCLQLS
jgi:predicted benzoate:H+ symporter BenE